MKFVVHLKGRGEGCDYTIGCNQKTIELPATIKTLDDARKHVIGNLNEDVEGMLDDYGIDNIETATIYTVIDEAVIDIDDIIRQRKDKEFLNQVVLQQKIDEAEFNRLKEKLGK